MKLFLLIQQIFDKAQNQISWSSSDRLITIKVPNKNFNEFLIQLLVRNIILKQKVEKVQLPINFSVQAFQNSRKQRNKSLYFFELQIKINLNLFKNYYYANCFIYLTQPKMNFNNQDLEAFLIEAQLVNQKVKALAQNKISPEEFDHLERLREQDRKRKQESKIRKQQQFLNKKKQGREGKGISKDFKNFCYFCRWQYQLETPNCLKCKKRTMSLQQRQKQLQVMVSDYKYKKKNREQRKHRWEMWKKTQQSLWKKTSNNYSKWDYFVSDSQEQPQQQPIVPKNDPNFMALQADLQQRKKRKQKDHSQANKLKEKGNQLMKQGNYEQAMHKYTLALEHAKDIKSVYTNRALAYIKLKKFKKAIKDCTNVIQYMEIFQKTSDNKDLTFKAYSRRAMANKEIKQYKIGLQDINQALKLFPDDKNGLLLKKQLQGLAEHAQKVERLLRENAKVNPEKNSTETKVEEKPEYQECQQRLQEGEQKQQQREEMDEESIRKEQRKIAKQLFEQQEKQQQKADQQQKQKQKPTQPQTNMTKTSPTAQKLNQSLPKTQLPKTSPIQQIKKNIQNLTPESIKQTFNLLIKDKDMIAIFIAAKGIQACLKQLLISQFTNQQALLISMCLDGAGVGEKAVWDFGVQKLHNRASELLNDTLNQKHHALQVCSDIFEILVPISLYQPYRVKLANDHKVHIFIEETYTKLLNKKKTRTQLLNIFIIYMSNLLSGADSGLKNAYFTKQKITTIIDSFFVYILQQKTHNRNFLDLKKNVYGLLANFATHGQHRKTIIDFFVKNNKFLQISNDLEQYPKSQNNFTQYIESILSVLVNITFDTSLELPQLAEILVSRFIKFRKVFSKEIVYRSLLIISRLKYNNPQIASKWLQFFEEISLEQKPLQNPTQKCNMSQIVKVLNILYTPVNGTSLQAEIPSKLFTVLSIYVRDNLAHENLFCNTANLFGVLAQSNLLIKDKIYEQVALGMKRLVDISKDKIGNWRKNAAILIAKCSSNPKVREAMEKEHAMDVIKTIAHLIAGK